MLVLLVIKLLWFPLHSFPYVSAGEGGRGGGIKGGKKCINVNFEFLKFCFEFFKKNVRLTLFLIYGQSTIL